MVVVFVSMSQEISLNLVEIPAGGCFLQDTGPYAPFFTDIELSESGSGGGLLEDM